MPFQNAGELVGIADFNRDGVADFVTFQAANEQAGDVLLGLGEGTFDDKPVAGPPGWRHYLADINADGLTDLLAVHS